MGLYYTHIHNLMHGHEQLMRILVQDEKTKTFRMNY